MKRRRLGCGGEIGGRDDKEGRGHEAVRVTHGRGVRGGLDRNRGLGRGTILTI